MRTKSHSGHLDRRSGKMTQGRGFTIIELLVAVGVTALLVSLMLGIVVNITKGWNRSSGSLESGNQARVILDQITSDLQAAILRNDGNVWMAANLGSPSPTWEGAGSNTAVIPPAATPAPPLENYRFGPSGVWFRFITTVPGTNEANKPETLSAPRAVAYQLVRLPVVAGSTEIRYQMFRSEVPPDDTFDAGYDLTDAAYIGSGTSLRSPNPAALIANNVVDFGVRILDEDGVIIFPKGPADLEFLATSDTTKGANVGMPASVEIFVRILSGEGAQQLLLFEDPPDGYTPSADWDDIVREHSRVYTRRVDLKAKGL